MKKLLTLCCALTLVFCAVACQRQEPQPAISATDTAEVVTEQPEQQPEQEQPEQQPEQELPAESQPRLGETELPVQVEGQTEQMQVILWQTESFSIYVPSTGWSKSEDQVWQADNNKDVRFFVLQYPDMDTAAAQQQLESAYPDYRFTVEEDNILTGKDDDRQLKLWVRLVPADSDCYAVCAQYPLEAAEGYGARLIALADTFQAK